MLLLVYYLSSSSVEIHPLDASWYVSQIVTEFLTLTLC